ncbi:site-specific integrase [Peribacillus muralis]|uniref:site-specific integrase n=1 Tax=Peribacillus muralis TaxID=264697 RepID=UPI001F4EFD07|nr:site-specific integrase [Peribacillus muralis]MCK1994899.1 site-specific integrase [Peribacillus muralis]MCK2015555.1 site-specific integrase [Peribacillus muralis]
MAHIHKRGDKWAYIVNVANDPSIGKRRQITKSGFRTKKEAQLAANKLEESILNGGVIRESNITFETFANEWLEYYGTQVKVSSVRARRIAMKHLVSTWGHLPLRKITKHMYQSRINELNKEFSPNYIDSIHTTGNMIFKHAIRQDLIKTNPTYGFVMPKKYVTVEDIEEDEVKEKFLELNELKTFLRITKEHGLYLDYLCFATLAYTGMRLGEMLALKWTDLDLTKKTIRITKTYYNPNNKSTGYQLLTPKTKKSIRTIMIDDGLVALFKAHKREQMELKMKQRLVYENQDFIFAENIGHPRVMKQMVLRLQRLMKRLDVDKHITPHSFRHTHTSLLIEAGAGVKEIQERLGHSDINTTMNIYAHMTKNIEEKTSHKFSELTKGLL